MASNYFGFTHGNTQYGATGAYQTGQPGYAVSHTAAAAAAAAGTYAATRAATSAYDTAAYQAAAATAATHNSAAAAAAAYPVSMFSGTGSAGTTAATFDYGYGRAATTAFDTAAKTYYQQPAVAATYAATEHYQAKPAYSTTSNLTTVTRTVTAPATTKPAYTTYQQAGTPSYTAAYTNTAMNKAAKNESQFVAVERNLITVPGYLPANITYVQQTTQTQPPVAKVVQQVQTVPVTNAVTATTNNWQNYKKGGAQNRLKPKQPPKPQQLHYCDICKISCAGPQTYREHLEGQKHKKKEAAGKAGTAPAVRSGNSLRCELCDVTCTGSDAYAAHIRGAKHQKVVKLHTKLGKPIPSTEPVVLVTKSSTPTTSSSGVVIKEEKDKDDKEDFKLPDEKDVQPVGQEYIEELRNDEGKIISFNCKLCECRFNDPNAKEMHMKGRRHRLQYKKKVDPELQVDIKPSLKQKKLQEEKLRRQALREELWSRRREEERWREEMRMLEEEERLFWEERRRYEEEMEYYEYCRRTGRFAGAAPPMPPPPRHFTPPMMMPPRRPESSDDRHVLAKHGEIYPKEEELAAIQAIVSNAEKALKLVSDCLAEADAPKEIKEEPKQPTPPTTAAAGEKGDKETSASEKGRVLRGVMRVGPLAKGLLLKGDLNVQLVVLCSEKPTRTLLDRVADGMPKQLQAVASETRYELRRCVEEAAIILQATTDPKICVTITLTSPVMREQGPEAGDQQPTPARDPPDVLDKQKCLDALAALRHSKWFQARANGLQSCVMVMRILRELCQRVPTWAPLNCWAMELLVERVIASAGAPLSPGESLRRIFEALACGILLPGGPGLLDPCEKDPTDATAVLSAQEREDITASAQHALRLIAFRQIHKVLGMEPLPVMKPKGGPGRFTRKRRRDNSTGEGGDGEGAEGKKDKKEEGDQVMDGIKQEK